MVDREFRRQHLGWNDVHTSKNLTFSPLKCSHESKKYAPSRNLRLDAADMADFMLTKPYKIVELFDRSPNFYGIIDRNIMIFKEIKYVVRNVD